MKCGAFESLINPLIMRLKVFSCTCSAYNLQEIPHSGVSQRKIFAR